MINPPVKLPVNKRWSQLNRGDLLGVLEGTRNITLNTRGYAKLSRRMKSIANDTDSSFFGEVRSIVFDAGNLANASTKFYYLITEQDICTLSQDLQTFAQETTSGVPGVNDESDGIIWNDGLYVTTSGDNLSKLVSGTWTGSLMSLTAGYPHPLDVSSVNNFLLVGNGNTVEKRTTAGTNSTAITIPSQYTILWIKSGNGRVFIGTTALNGGDGAVFEWDETSAAANYRHDIEGGTALSGEFLGSDFYVIADNGQLLRFDGGGFTPEAVLPIYEAIEGAWVAVNGYSVAHRGMRAINGRLLINVNSLMELVEYVTGTNGRSNLDIFPSGVWEYLGNGELSHKYGLSVSTSSEDFCQHAYRYDSPGAIAPIYKNPQTGYAPESNEGIELLAGA